MKYSTFFFLIFIVLFSSSCNDPVVINRMDIRTLENNNGNYHFWKSPDNDNFSFSTAQFDLPYNAWVLSIGQYWGGITQDGYINHVVGNENSFNGYLSWQDNKSSSSSDDITHVDSIRVQYSPRTEGGWSQATYRSVLCSFNVCGVSTSTPIENIFIVRPETVDPLNCLNVYDKNNNYQFSFKTRNKNDQNAWLITGIPSGWMDNEGRAGIWIIPALFTCFQH